MFSVSRKSGPYYNDVHKIRIRSNGPHVIMLIDEAAVELSTPAAYKVAWSIIKQTDDMLDGEIIVLKINNKPISLLPGQARQVAAGLFRKSDDADNFQLRVM